MLHEQLAETLRLLLLSSLVLLANGRLHSDSSVAVKSIFARSDATLKPASPPEGMNLGLAL